MGNAFHLVQISMNVKMRADAFAAFGALSNYGVGAHKDAFLEQVVDSVSFQLNK